MAKFNITVELDWVDEDGGIDAVVKDEIINTICNKFSKKLTDEILKTAERKISSQLNNSVDVKVDEIMDKLLNNNFDLLDDYGDVIKRNTSTIQIIKEKLDKFLTEKVDKDGKASNYSSIGTRLDYIINKNIDYTMQRKVELAAAEIKKGLESYVDTTLKQQIGENVAKLIGVDKIIAKNMK